MTAMIAINLNVLERVFLLTALSFSLAMLLTPPFTNFLYRHRLGKRIRKTDYAGNKAPIFASLHAGKENTPTMGGLLIWVTTALLTLGFNLDRAGTWLPLFALVATGAIGALDDLLNIRGIGPHRGGLRFRHKLPLYAAVAAVGAWWFYSKLDWSVLHIPFYGLVEIGWWYIPLFIVVLVGLAFAVNSADGLDGLAGGMLITSFGAFTLIALAQGKIPLALFCGTVVGALLAFLWFNIYPARFFMGDTGSMSLGMTLGVVAFLTNSVLVLAVIGLPFLLEAGSVVVQITSKRFFGRKVFLSSPIHHHFEALGWPETKVTMRFWVVSAVTAVIGLILALVGGI